MPALDALRRRLALVRLRVLLGRCGVRGGCGGGCGAILGGEIEQCLGPVNLERAPAVPRRQRSVRCCGETRFAGNALVVGARGLRLVVKVAQRVGLSAAWNPDECFPLAASLVEADAVKGRRPFRELLARRLGRGAKLRQRHAAQAPQLSRRQRPQVGPRRVAAVQEPGPGVGGKSSGGQHASSRPRAACRARRRATHLS